MYLNLCLCEILYSTYIHKPFNTFKTKREMYNTSLRQSCIKEHAEYGTIVTATYLHTLHETRFLKA